MTGNFRLAAQVLLSRESCNENVRRRERSKFGGPAISGVAGRLALGSVSRLERNAE
jgi:hypothetical protein